MTKTAENGISETRYLLSLTQAPKKKKKWVKAGAFIFNYKKKQNPYCPSTLNVTDQTLLN
jgi:hypothetical protein